MRHCCKSLHRSLLHAPIPFHTTYDSAGAIKKMQLGNGRWETFVSNERLQIKQIGLGVTDADQNLLKLELGYGTSTQNNGSLREQKITVPGLANPFIQIYTYDDLNRLKSATETNGGSETWKQTFEIDRYGNREFDAANTTTLGSCLSAVCDPNINTSDNRFSSGQGYSYNLNGNVTQDAAGQRFGYDAENHQKEFFATGNATSTPDATYSYDGEGRRVKKTSNTETTVFVYNASGKLVAEYSTALATTPQVSYLTTDHLGSPRVVTNENGTVRDRKDYSAFGEESVSSQRSSNPEYSAADQLRKNYTGYEKDGESGLEFAQARYYNSTHGRFTSVDPLTASASIRNPQTFNRYSYVLNSPYKFNDPLGLLFSSTGACGNGCPGSDGGGGSFGSGHDSSAADYFDNQQTQQQAETPSQAGGVQVAPGLTQSQVSALVDAFSEVYATEGGYEFFSSFDNPEFDATLVLNVGDLSKHDTKDAKGNSKTTWGLTSVKRDEDGHLTITITIDVERIDKAVADKRAEDTKNRDRVVGQVITTGVVTREEVGKHEVSHGIHALGNPEDYQKQAAAGTAEDIRAGIQAEERMSRKSTAEVFKKDKASSVFKKIIGYDTYKFTKK